MSENTNLPATMRGLTDQERAFVMSYVSGGDAEAAKLVSGYSTSTAGWYVLRRSHIAAAVRAEIVRQMATEGAQIGFKSLKRIARDEKLPAAAQVAAAKALLQGAGLLDAPAGDKETKSINDMSREELRAYIDAKRADIDKMEAAIADRATPIPQTIDAQATDKPSIFD